MSGSVAVGSVWVRNPPGKERVRVGRVWECDGPTVRAHPVHGGRPLIAYVDWFMENFSPASVEPQSTEEQT